MISPLCFLFLTLFSYRPVTGGLDGYFGGNGPHFGGHGPHFGGGAGFGGGAEFGGGSGFGGQKLFHEGATFGHHFGGVGSGLGRTAFSHGFGGSKFVGGSEENSKHFNGGGRGLDGEYFQKSHGISGGELSHGDLGHFKGEGEFKDVKGESGHFYDADGGKKEHHDGKSYYDGQHFGKEGKSGVEKTAKQGHRKGHTVKGFSTSHHKDEAEKTEEYFDEAHDEGGNVAFDGHSGKFGEIGASSSKGKHLDGKFNAGESKKGVHYDKEFVNGKAHGSQGHFGGKKFAGHDSTLGEHKVLGEDDVEAHHESSKLFKQHPSFY